MCELFQTWCQWIRTLNNFFDFESSIRITSYILPAFETLEPRTRKRFEHEHLLFASEVSEISATTQDGRFFQSLLNLNRQAFLEDQTLMFDDRRFGKQNRELFVQLMNSFIYSNWLLFYYFGATAPFFRASVLKEMVRRFQQPLCLEPKSMRPLPTFTRVQLLHYYPLLVLAQIQVGIFDPSLCEFELEHLRKLEVKNVQTDIRFTAGRLDFSRFSIPVMMILHLDLTRQPLLDWLKTHYHQNLGTDELTAVVARNDATLATCLFANHLFAPMSDLMCGATHRRSAFRREGCEYCTIDLRHASADLIAVFIQFHMLSELHELFRLLTPDVCNALLATLSPVSGQLKSQKKARKEHPYIREKELGFDFVKNSKMFTA